jgi:hypothetical protein
LSAPSLLAAATRASMPPRSAAEVAFEASVVEPPPPDEEALETGALDEADPPPDEEALDAGAELDALLAGALDALLLAAAELDAELDDELLDELLLLVPDPLLDPHAETIRATAAKPASAPLRRRTVRL